jgi:hypothetical protein
MLTVLNAQKSYQVKRQSMAGEEYIVVPITMLAEGVHCGNQGCFLYDKKIIAESVKAWAGKPITVNHPADGLGQPCLCNTPNIFDCYVIGHVFNPRLENAALKADGWLNLKRMASISNNLLDKLLKGDMINVSTGLTANGLSEKGGVWNNEQYIGEILGITPDHLAILPNDDGACSLQDGCGVRNKADSKRKPAKGKLNGMKWNEKIINAVKRHFDKIISDTPFINADSMMDQINFLRSHLDSLDTLTKRHQAISQSSKVAIHPPCLALTPPA